MGMQVVNPNTQMGASGADHSPGTVPDPGSTAGTAKFLREDATFQDAVQSVSLTVPTEFIVTGSPITTSGTLAVTKAVQSSNMVWAGPTSGSAAPPAFRGLIAADAPFAAPTASPTFTGTITQPDMTVLTAPTTATSATTGTASALPADPAGYLQISLNGTNFKIPYYNV